MAKQISPRTASRIHQVIMFAFALWLALAGLFIHIHPVKAATLSVTYTGSDLPAVVGTAWSRTYSASGGTAPYSCSISGTVPDGLSFNTSTCTLSGTPADFGSSEMVINFSDSAKSTNYGSASLSYTAEANTQIILTLTSTHPDGENHYVAGYPVWVHADVNFNPAISGKQPAGTINVTSGTDGPSCSIDLDTTGEGECALVFPSEGSKTVQVGFIPSETYVRSSSASQTISVEPLHVPPSLSAGRNHTCYLAENGWMTCWGLTDALPTDSSKNPISVGFFSKITSGGYQTCGLNVDGTIACWGDNTDVTGNIPSGKYVDISSGDEHVCAIDTVNRLHCWGNMSTELAKVPADRVTSVSGGINYDCAIRKNNSRPICWGSVTSAPSVSLKAVAVGNTHTCGVRTDGSLTCWGSPAMSVPSGSNYTAIDSGSNYSCAQKNGGTLACWGSGSPGVDTTTAFSRFASGFLHTCALKPSSSTFTLSCWGDNSYGKAPRIAISPTSIPEFLVKGKAYSQAFTASGGNSPYSITSTAGLPAGLTLSGGIISGTLTTPNSYSFTLSAMETYPGSGLPLQLTPGARSYSTIVIDGSTTTSLSLPASVNAGSPAKARVTVSKIPPAPALTGSVLVSSADGDTSCRAEVGLNGVAECTLYFSRSGTKVVNVVYGGDEYYATSTGSSLITVNPVTITPTVGAGSQFSCAIDADGQVDCWGKNDSGQSTPPSIGVFDQIDLGMSHACALGLNRRVSCWGWNGYNIATPPTDGAFIQVTTGDRHTCVLSDTGAVSCWGFNDSSRLTVPSAGSYTYTNIDAGSAHTCALLSSGGVNCWGVNTNGQTSVPSDLLSRGLATKISSGGTFSCGLHADGSIECWGGSGSVDSIRTEPSGVFTDLSAGGSFACGLKADGNVACWGGLTSSPSGSFTKIAAGLDHACGILSNGRMLCWGSDTLGQAPVISISPASLATKDAGTTWQAQLTATGGRIAQYTYSIPASEKPAGLLIDSNTGLISADPASGTTLAAGTYSFTVTAQEASLTPAIAGARTYSLVVRGKVNAKVDSALPANVMVGQPIRVSFSVHAQPGNSMGANPTGHVVVTAEENRCEVDLVDGAGSCWMLFSTPGKKSIIISYPGDSLYQPGQSLAFEYTAMAFSQAAQIRISLDHTYIYKVDGTAGCIGANCQLGLPDTIWTRLEAGDSYSCGLQTNGQITCASQNNASALMFEHGPYIDLSVGNSHVCSLKIDGQVECQGDSTSGQASPPAGTFTSLSSGGEHTCALKENGEAACWGNISSPPAGSFIQLVSGDAHTCGITQEGNAVCWGDDRAGQSTPPTIPEKFTQIAAGGFQTCGLDMDGAVTCWGDDSSGQTQPIYGKFIAVDTYDDHTCALREGLEITCWGHDDAGEAPQYSFDPLTDLSIPALSYFEHAFNILGGTKPLTAEITEGQLPPGLDTRTEIPAEASIESTPSEVINDLSPAGLILYGTPTIPGIFPFVVRWTDVSPYPIVTEQPYTMTITGGDLAVELSPFSTANALEGMDYQFKAVIMNHTALPVPEALLTIEVPEGLTDVRTDFDGCEWSEQTLECSLSNVKDPVTIWVTSRVELKSGQDFTVNAIIAPTLPDWPELNDIDNNDSITAHVSAKSIIYEEDFESSTEAETAPNGQKYLSVLGGDTLTLTLSNLPAHKSVRVSFDVYAVGPWLGNNSGGLPSEWKLDETMTLLDTSFSNDAGFRQAYPGRLPNGNYSARSGAEGLDELGYMSEGNPVPDSRYHMSFKFSHTAEDLTLIFQSLNLPVGAWWGLDNLKIEIDNGQTKVFIPLITLMK